MIKLDGVEIFLLSLILVTVAACGIGVNALVEQEKLLDSKTQSLPNSPVKEMKPGASGRLYILLENGTMWKQRGDLWIEVSK